MDDLECFVGFEFDDFYAALDGALLDSTVDSTDEYEEKKGVGTQQYDTGMQVLREFIRHETEIETFLSTYDDIMRSRKITVDVGLLDDESRPSCMQRFVGSWFIEATLNHDGLASILYYRRSDSGRWNVATLTAFTPNEFASMIIDVALNVVTDINAAKAEQGLKRVAK